MRVSFHIKRIQGLALLQFAFPGILTPRDLRRLSPPDPVESGLSRHGVVLSGRGPIWLYGYLVHHYHPCRFVAVHDPRLGGAVVVESHHPDHALGDLIYLDTHNFEKTLP